MKYGKFKIPNIASLMNIYVFKYMYLRLDLHDLSSINVHGYTCTQLDLHIYDAIQFVLGGFMNAYIQIQEHVYTYVHALSYTFKE